VATQDIHINLKNRNHAVKEYGYGPLNPDEPNDKFWKRLADRWGITPVEAKTSRCKNCAAFVQTKEMLACIEKGISFDPDEPEENNTAEAVTAKVVQDKAKVCGTNPTTTTAPADATIPPALFLSGCAAG
jgi:hypothetical protein